MENSTLDVEDVRVIGVDIVTYLSTIGSSLS